MRRTFLPAAFLLCLGFLLISWPQPSSGDLHFTDFVGAESSLHLVGGARIVRGELELVDGEPNTAKAVWAREKQYVFPGFRAQFEYTAEYDPDKRGTGFSFTIQNSGSSSVGTSAEGLGYADYQNKLRGIDESVSLEFDFWQDESMDDPDDNHISLHSVANEPNSAHHDHSLGINAPGLPDLEGHHTVWLEYIANTSFTVAIDDPSATHLEVTELNLPDWMDLIEEAFHGRAWIGFTASTGDEDSQQFPHFSIQNWHVWDGNVTVDPEASKVTGPALDGTPKPAGDAVTFTVQLVDIHGWEASKSPLAGDKHPDWSISATLTPVGSDGEAVEVTFTDNKDGSFTGSFIPLKPAEYSLSVEVLGIEVPDSPFPITVVVGPFSPEHAVVSGTGLLGCVAGEFGPVHVQGKDRAGNDLEIGGTEILCEILFKEDEMAVAAAVDLLSFPCTVEDLKNGEYEVMYNSTRSGIHVLSLSVLDETEESKIPVGGSPWEPLILPAAAFPALCVPSGDALVTVIAGEENEFVIQTFDRFGNPLLDGDVSEGFDITVEKGGESFSVESLGNGNYTAVYRTLKSGVQTLRITLDGTDIAGSPFQELLVLPNVASPESIAEGPGLIETLAGSEAEFTIQSRDEFGNPLLTGGAEFEIEFTDIPGEVEAEPELKDLGNGNYTVTYTTIHRGEYVLEIRLNATNITGSPFRIQTLSSGVPVPELTTAAGEGLSGGRAGQTLRFAVVLHDEYGNQLHNGGFTEQLNITALLGEGNDEIRGSLTDNTDGTYTAALVVTQAGEYVTRIVFDETEIPGSPFPGLITPGFLSSPNSTAEGEGLQWATAGELGMFIVTARDMYGNIVEDNDLSWQVALGGGPGPVIEGGCESFDVGTYLCGYNQTVAGGPYTLSVKGEDGKEIQNGPHHVSVLPGPPDAAGSTAAGPGLTGGEAGETLEFEIQVRDRFGNPHTERVPDVHNATVEFTPSDDPLQAINISRTEQGTFAVNYRLSLVREIQMFVSLDGEAIQASPFTPQLEASETDGTKSTATGRGLEGGHAGIPAQFEVQTKDRFGNPLQRGGDEVTVQVAEPGVLTSIQDNTDGTYSVVWESEAATDITLDVRVNGVEIIGSPFTVRITADPHPAADFSKLFGPGLDGGVVGDTLDLLLVAYDQFNNPVEHGGNASLIALDIPGSEGFTWSVQDLLNGSYALEFRTETADPAAQLGVTINGEHLKGSPFSIPLAPGPLDPKKGEAAGEGLELGGPFGAPLGFRLHLADGFGNRLREWPDDPVEVSVSVQPVGDVLQQPFSEPSTVEGECTPIPSSSQGHTTAAGEVGYDCVFSAPEEGNFGVHVEINGDEILGSPFPVQIVRGIADPEKTSAEGPGLEGGVAGEKAVFTVQTRDERGNPLFHDDTVFKGRLERERLFSFAAGLSRSARLQQVFHRSQKPSSVEPLEIEFEYLEDGTFQGSFTPTVAPALFNLYIQLSTDGPDGDFHDISGTPISDFRVQPGAPAGQETILENAKLSFDTENGGVFRLRSRDRLQNPVAVGGLEFRATLLGPQEYEGKVKDREDGRYTVEFAGPLREGSYDVFVQYKEEDGSFRDIPNSPFPVSVEDLTSGSGGLSGAAIAGIVCGILLLVVLVAVLLYRHRQSQRWKDTSVDVYEKLHRGGTDSSSSSFSAKEDVGYGSGATTAL